MKLIRRLFVPLMILTIVIGWTADAWALTPEAEMTAFLNAKIPDGLSELDCLRRITKHVAEDFTYNARYSDWQDLARYGGGDCWASTYYILEACHRLGIEAVERQGYKDDGAASNHRNALAEIDGDLYIAEAGISGASRASLSGVRETDDYSGTLTRGTDGKTGAKLYQYERGQIDRAMLRHLVLPSRFMTVPVVELAARFNANNNETVSVSLPSTLQTIGSNAFYGNKNLRGVTLPNSLVNIGTYAFAFCASLGQIEIPANVKTLPAYSFRSCGTLTVIVSGKETTIADRAFHMTDVTLGVKPGSTAETFAKEKGLDYFLVTDFKATMTLPAGLTEIEAEAFRGLPATGIQLPRGLVRIGSKAFTDCRKLTQVYIPPSVTDIADDAFDTPGLVIYGQPGSAAEAYAREHGFAFLKRN